MGAGLLAFCASSARSDEKVVRNELVPPWIESFQTEYDAELPKSGTTADVHYLLTDRQIHAEEHTRYNHLSYRFLTESGVQDNSQLSISFDPNYETLTLHQLRIKRGGEIVDKLAGQKIEVIRRETGAERQIYDGRLSAMMVLEDTRVGDVVEYAYSIRGANPVFDGHFFSFETTRWAAPVHQSRLRVWWDEGRPVTMKNQGSPKGAELSSQGKMRVAKLDEERLPAIVSDGDLPGFFFSHPWIEFSDFADWDSISKWAAAQFPVTQELPPAAQKEVERIRALPDEQDRILSAVRWVQDSIRYVGFFHGIHSHQPFPLDTVMSRRFGDCKDKSNLLATMLRSLGVSCRIGLVSTQSRHAIREWLPTPEAFDHAIVGVDSPTGMQWIDGTASYQRGPLRDLYMPDYAWVLPVEPEGSSLVTFKPTGHEVSKTESREDYVFKDYRGSVTFTVTTIHSGSRADSQRAYFASNSRDEIERNYLNYYAESHPKIRSLTPLQVLDDEVKNKLTTVEKYELQEVWKPNSDRPDSLEFKVNAQLVSSEFFEPDTRIRTMPFLVPNPRNITQTFHVEFPSPLELNNDFTRISNPAFEFTVRETSAETSTDVVYHYHSKRNFVGPQDASTYLAEIKEAKKQVGYSFSIPVSYAESTADEIAADKGSSLLKPENSRTAWTLVIVSSLSLLASTAVCIFLFFWDPSRRPPVYQYVHSPQGLAGWLLLVGFGIVLRPFIQIWSAYRGLQELTAENWSALTQEGSSVFHPLWEPVIIIESAWSASLIPLGFLVMILFFQCRTSFPYIFGAVLIYFAVGSWADDVCINKLPITDEEVIREARTQSIRGFTSCAIWVPYLAMSKRVRNTFIRRRKVNSNLDREGPPPLPQSLT
jgi:hypothetical protein